MGKRWLRYAAAILIGVAIGLGAAWAFTSRVLAGGQIVNGAWSTSLGYGVRSTVPLMRAAVARSGLLALPARETIYWQATQDSAGRALDGNCRYRLTGKPLGARWWSVTVYDANGYLMPNPARVWSVNGASVALGDAGNWAVVLASDKPAQGGWLPVAAGRAFHLTLRMYNPDRAFMAAPTRAQLPRIVRESCA